MNKINTGLDDQALMGTLMDEYTYRFATSPWKGTDKRALPLVYISPALAWGMPIVAMQWASSNQPSCILLSVIPLISCQRMTYGGEISPLQECYEDPV